MCAQFEGKEGEELPADSPLLGHDCVRARVYGQVARGWTQIRRSDVLPELGAGQTDTVWQAKGTKVVAITPEIYRAFHNLCAATEKDVKTHFDQFGEMACWSKTSHTLEQWKSYLGLEALTDVASAASSSQIRVVGPWKQGVWWPRGLPCGGEAQPYTEIVRVVVQGHAPCLEQLSRCSGTVLTS